MERVSPVYFAGPAMAVAHETSERRAPTPPEVNHGARPVFMAAPYVAKSGCESCWNCSIDPIYHSGPEKRKEFFRRIELGWWLTNLDCASFSEQKPCLVILVT